MKKGSSKWTEEKMDFVRYLRAKGRKYPEICRQWVYRFGEPVPTPHALCNAFSRHNAKE